MGFKLKDLGEGKTGKGIEAIQTLYEDVLEKVQKFIDNCDPKQRIVEKLVGAESYRMKQFLESIGLAFSREDEIRAGVVWEFLSASPIYDDQENSEFYENTKLKENFNYYYDPVLALQEIDFLEEVPEGKRLIDAVAQSIMNMEQRNNSNVSNDFSTIFNSNDSVIRESNYDEMMKYVSGEAFCSSILLKPSDTQDAMRFKKYIFVLKVLESFHAKYVAKAKRAVLSEPVVWNRASEFQVGVPLKGLTGCFFNDKKASPQPSS